jgi:ribose transport system permease protein
MTAGHSQMSARNKGSSAMIRSVDKLGLLIVVILFGIVLSIASPVFLSWQNILNVLLQSTILATLAIGQSFVIVTGGIDLSVGGVLAVSSAVAVGLMNVHGLDAFTGILIALLIGAVFGVFNGLAIARFGVAPLIVTLASMGLARGVTLVYTNGMTMSPVPNLFVTIGTAKVFGIPIMMIIVIMLAIVASIILNKTVFGRSVYATGGNKLAAKLAGIRTDRIVFMAYVISGITAAIAGVLLASRLESVGPNAGSGIELSVVAAVVIGGTSLFGGQGNISGTILGVILLSLVSNAISLLSIPPSWDQLVQGSVIFLAALLDVYRRKYTFGKA